MLTVCFAAVCVTEAANDSNVISSDDVVTLDVTKSYRENSSELAKLGITKFTDWTYDEEHGCYVLTLDNVHFRTSANVGIMFTAPASVQNPTVAIELVGRNSIASGSNLVVPASIVGISCAAGILASHKNTTGVEMEDFRVAFIGEGSIVVENVNASGYLKGSAGIDVYGSLLVAHDATVVASAANIEKKLTTAPSEATGEKDLYSVGVYVAKTIAVVSQKDGPARLIGTGGSVDVYFTKNCYDGVHDLYSEGMSASSYYIVNSYVSGTGDHVGYGALEYLGKEKLKIQSTSAGISTRDELIIAERGTHAYISNSKVVGTAQYAEGREYAESVGIELGDEERIVIEDSILIGVGDIAESDTKNANRTAFVYTEGITLFGITEIKNSYVQGISGDQAIISNDKSFRGLYGIYGRGDMTIKDSIVIANGHGLADQGLEKLQVSYGIVLYQLHEIKQELTIFSLNVLDSEVYLASKTASVVAKEINASEGYWAYSYDTGTKKTITTETMGKCLTASLVYKNDVVLVNSVFGVMDFYRVNSNTVVVGPYLGPVPDGMRFAGFYDIEGNKLTVGSTVTLGQFNIIETSFEHIVESDDDNNSWIVWVVVIIALVVIALMTAGLYVWKSR